MYTWVNFWKNRADAIRHLGSTGHDEEKRKAILYYRRALRFCSERRSARDWAEIHLGLGYLYQETGCHVTILREAVASYEASLRYYQDRTDMLEYRSAHNNLGMVYFNLARSEDHDQKISAKPSPIWRQHFRLQTV